MPHGRHATLLLLVVGVLTLTACGDAAPTAGSDEPAATPTVEAAPSVPDETASPAEPEVGAEPAVEVPEILDFTAQTLEGETFEGASLADTDTLLWFWAPWCPVCQREAPVVASLAEEYAGRVEVLGIGGLSGDLRAMQDFVQRGGVGGVTHLADTEGSIYARFGVTQQYDIGVLDDSGDLRVVTGPLSEAELRAEMDALAES
ncbi:MAG TPA: redoxin domain-containing protein [Jiangellales bacterium]|nr:redoxin domain-containing protein [Jiangellales bacterium]